MAKGLKFNSLIYLVFVFVAILFRYMSMWGFIDSGSRYVFFIPFLIFIFFLIVFKKKFTRSELSKVAILFICSIYIFFSSGEIDFIVSLILAIAFLKKDGDKQLIKYYVLCSIPMFVMTILLYKFGILNGYNAIRNVDGNVIIRQSLGFSNVNAVYMYFMPIITGICLLYVNNKKARLVFTAICFSISLYLYLLTNSRTGFYVIIFYLISLWLSNKSNSVFTKNKAILFLFICILITALLGYYGTDINNLFNRLLTNRPFIINRYMSQGLPPLFWQKMGISLDNTYGWLLYINGVLATLIYLIIFFKSLKLIANNKRILVLLFTYLLYFVFERLLVYATNFLFIIQLMYIISNDKSIFWLECGDEKYER